MSNTVLATKWRPKLFSDLIGQEPVVTALINSLDNQRLHHTYLFTGTRGVGKTTLARILAKCLNCEVNGVSSEPCGKCDSCLAIDAGQFVDLYEVDAASRTKVEDTRDLLENVQYMPTQGRYKIYLIDEVHMLSSHSFNALLKTLEEPPEYVKFILATTDQQKIPSTILSRCLHFNLNRISQDTIQLKLKTILEQEQVKFEDSAIKNISKIADGSMRDALSITEQCISHGDNMITYENICKILCLIPSDKINQIVKKIIDNPIKKQGITNHRVNGNWICGGASNAGCGILSQFFSDLEIKELSRQINPSKNTSLNLLPLNSKGERFPVNDSNLKPILGPRPVSDSLYLHALFEGLAKIELKGWEKIGQLTGSLPKKIITIGGGSKNPQWRKIRENIINIPIVSCKKTTSFGTALLAINAK